MRESGLVSGRREGQWVHYRIREDLPEWLWGVLREVFEGVVDRPPFSADAKALDRLSVRPGALRCG